MNGVETTATFKVNDIEDVEITFFVERDTLIPENKPTLDITIVDCNPDVRDCFGERYIENIIREEIENGRE